MDQDARFSSWKREFDSPWGYSFTVRLSTEPSVRSECEHTFVPAAKSIERHEARRLRAAGVPLQRIAKRLNVSVSSVYAWTRDIPHSKEQRVRNLRAPGGPQSPEVIAKRAAACAETARKQRRRFQEEGRAAARRDEHLHLQGCFLYWAEGSKDRNRIVFTNSDAIMLELFCRFLTQSLGIEPARITLSINAYTNNGLTIEEIEAHWLQTLGLEPGCVRKHTLNHTPTSSSGRKRGRLPYGVCSLSVGSTRFVQHIYGAIQEYGGFEEPKWLG